MSGLRIIGQLHPSLNDDDGDDDDNDVMDGCYARVQIPMPMQSFLVSRAFSGVGSKFNLAI